MGSVVSYSTEKMNELLAAGVVGATITDGHLILNLRGGTTIDVGSVLSDLPDATNDTKGVVEFATDAETVEGTSANKAVTPLGLKAAAQPLDPDLSALSNLGNTNGSVIQRRGGVLVESTLNVIATDMINTGEFVNIMLHNGTTYADTDHANVFIGPVEPTGGVQNGTIWYDTTGA